MPARRPPLAILLPPSEGKAEGGGLGTAWDPWSGGFGPQLGQARELVAAALAATGGGDEKLLGVRGKHLTRAREANTRLVGAPTMPAGQRYTGVVWDHLDLPSLTLGARRRARDSIIVVSGLLGLAQIDDPVPEYKLRIGASLPPIGKLATWWRGRVSDALDHRLEGRFVIDLLPQEHRAIWAPRPERLGGGMTVTFVARSARNVAGHDAKAAKGRLARHLLLATGSVRNALASWQDERFDAVAVPL